MITLTIPAVPPSVNHMYTTLRGGKKALAPEVAAFRGLVLQAVLLERRAVPDGPLSLTLRIWPKAKRKSDLDNTLKVLIDSLAQALRFNDARIWHIHATRMPCDGHARCEVTIAQWEGRC